MDRLPTKTILFLLFVFLLMVFMSCAFSSFLLGGYDKILSPFPISANLIFSLLLTILFYLIAQPIEPPTRILPDNEMKTVWMAIFFMIIALVLLLIVFLYSNSSAQSQQLIFMCLFSMGLLYESEKDFICSPLLARLGRICIYSSLIGLSITIALYCITMIEKSSEITIQIISLIAPLILAVGIFFTRHSFRKIEKAKNSK